MRRYEISEEDGKVVLLLGDTKGGLTMIHIDAEYPMAPSDAREMAEDLISVADKVEGKNHTGCKS